MHLTTLLTTPAQCRQTRQRRDKEAFEEAERLAEARRESILNAQEFVADFVRERWGQHWHMIRIESDVTEAELRDLGRLPRDEGVRACCRLVRVPVIYEEIAIALWERLAEDVAEEGKGAESDSFHSTNTVPPATDLPTPWTKTTSRHGTNIGRRASNTTEIPEKEAQEQPRRGFRCVLCTGCSELACRIPEEITKLSTTEARDEEEWEGEIDGERKKSSESSKVSRRTSRFRKIWAKVNSLAFQRAISAFLGSLAYGYGHRVHHVLATPATMAT